MSVGTSLPVGSSALHNPVSFGHLAVALGPKLPELVGSLTPSMREPEGRPSIGDQHRAPWNETRARVCVWTCVREGVCAMHVRCVCVECWLHGIWLGNRDILERLSVAFNLNLLAGWSIRWSLRAGVRVRMGRHPCQFFFRSWST